MKKDLKQKKVLWLINSLTVDEDLRQDLWVDYLSGATFKALFKKVIDIQCNNTIPNNTQLQSIQNIISNPPPEKFLNYFNDIEKSIMCLLAIGYNIGDVCVLLGISKVNIDRIIVDISLNEAWSTYGIKEKLQR